jgi:hypothetical protein
MVSSKFHHYHSLEPPEMNTNQLLLISTLGLGVNLFGMFAMGGHHHHVSGGFGFLFFGGGGTFCAVG